MKLKIFFLITIFSVNLYAQDNSDWIKIFEENEITIYSQRAEDAIIPFKAIGFINKNMTSVLNTLMDHKNKHKWAPKLKEVKIHKKISDNEFIFSEYYSTPWPASDREFLLRGKVRRINNEKIILEARSISSDDYLNPTHIQSDVKFLNIILNKVSQNKTRIQFEFHGDMKGWMPVWLMNLIQKKWPLRFIQGLQNYN